MSVQNEEITEFKLLLHRIKQKDPRLANLKLSSNELGVLTNDEVKELVKSINCSPIIKTLFIDNLHLSVLQYSFFSEMLESNCTLSSLTFSKEIDDSNTIKEKIRYDTYAVLLARGLKKNKTLTFLDVDFCDLGENAMCNIFDTIQKNDTIKIFSFYNTTTVTEISVNALSDMIQQNKTLSDLHLGGIKNVGIEKIFPMLSNSPIRSLSFSDTYISDEDLKIIAKCILENKCPNLTQLILYNCQITVKSAKTVADLLAVNTSLTSFKITGEYTFPLTFFQDLDLTNNTRLLELQLGNYDFNQLNKTQQDPQIKRIQNCLNGNKQLCPPHIAVKEETASTPEENEETFPLLLEYTPFVSKYIDSHLTAAKEALRKGTKSLNNKNYGTARKHFITVSDHLNKIEIVMQKENVVEIAEMYVALALSFKKLNEIDEVITQLKRADRIMNIQAFHFYRADILSHLGDAYQSIDSRGNEIDAREKALNIEIEILYSETLDPDHNDRPYETLLKLVSAYSSLRRFNDANACLDQAARLRREFHADQPALLAKYLIELIPYYISEIKTPDWQIIFSLLIEVRDLLKNSDINLFKPNEKNLMRDNLLKIHSFFSENSNPAFATAKKIISDIASTLRLSKEFEQSRLYSVGRLAATERGNLMRSTNSNYSEEVPTPMREYDRTPGCCSII